MLLFTPLLISLLFFSGLAVAGIVAPDCPTPWNWSFNSLGQNPCLVVAYMMSTCNGGSFTVESLPPGQHYIGPSGADNSNFCKCSTIAYSLISACDGCQGSNWITWSEYSLNCTKKMDPGLFPNPIPDGTRLPQWALLDVTNENLWNANKSYATGATPELGPGTTPGSSNSSSTKAYPSTSASGSSRNSATPVPAVRHSSNTGAIAGGVAGSIAGISVLIAALLFYRCKRQPAQPALSTIDEEHSVYNSYMDQVYPRSTSGPGTITSSRTLPDTNPSLLRTYNPDDPSTFPTHQLEGHLPPPYFDPYDSVRPRTPPSSSGKPTNAAAPSPNRDSQGGRGYSGYPEL